MTSCVLWREKFFQTALKEAGSELRWPHCLGCQTVTILFDQFRHKFVFVSAAFDSLHHFAAVLHL